MNGRSALAGRTKIDDGPGRPWAQLRIWVPGDWSIAAIQATTWYMPAVGSGNAADVAEVAQPRESGGSGFGRHVRDDEGGACIRLDCGPAEWYSPFSTNRLVE